MYLGARRQHHIRPASAADAYYASADAFKGFVLAHLHRSQLVLRMIAVIDYGLGNVGSVANMLRKLGIPVTITAHREEITNAKGVILPGVGHFDEGMRKLRQHGLPEVLATRARSGVPILGICLGMQLMARRSEEGTEPGLGWVPADVKRLDVQAPISVPHMGWNDVRSAPGPLFDGLPDARFYFVHSYHVVPDDPDDVIGWATHGREFVAAIRRGVFWGTQFHPEKSHTFGMKLLRNFATMVGGLG